MCAWREREDTDRCHSNSLGVTNACVGYEVDVIRALVLRESRRYETRALQTVAQGIGIAYVASARVMLSLTRIE